MTFYGFLQLPDGLEWNPDSPAYTTITITIKAAPGSPDDSNNDNGSKPAADNSSDTGDSSSLAPWIALMLLAGAGITGAGFYSRRKRANE